MLSSTLVVLYPTERVMEKTDMTNSNQDTCTQNSDRL